MRAREPDTEGFVAVDGLKLGYEVHGSGTPTLLLLPTWTIVHSRFWKAQIPYLARHHRVVTFDGPGNGRADRPLDPGCYGSDVITAAALEVLDATQTAQAVLLSLSKGTRWSLQIAAQHHERVLGQVLIAPSLDLTPQAPERQATDDTFWQQIDDPQGWQKYNAHHWLTSFPDFAEFFFEQCFSEPHSTKQREDAVGWALETTPEVLLAEEQAAIPDRDTVLAWCEAVETPVLVLHGSDDRISPLSRGEALAAATGGQLVVLEGAGHIPLARDPVKVNLLVHDFVQRVVPGARGAPAAPPARWVRGRARRRRALYVSSPIGLGHVRRDIATVEALRRHHPDLQVEWLAQHPVTRVLEGAGEVVHPASGFLASESAHMESEAGEHDLRCFQAWRRMDEILVADFLVFADVVAGTQYDLVVGDEAWDVDYYLHENPELKRFAYAWATDFVGWLPMPEGGRGEAELTADYNAEMIEHIARYPRVRDAALFVGSPDDVVDERFGADLPMIREWTEQHYAFPGYITGFDPAQLGDRAEVREQLGYGPDEQVCVVTVGGSGVGAHLLRRVLDAFPLARSRVPGLRMVAVAGPRIDPDRLPSHEGLEVHGFVPDLYRHLAVCDLAIVQGGLTTCMELTAARTPFVYVPLRGHFEQNLHVAHRLRRHGAGRRLDYADATPDRLAEIITDEIGREVEYRPVETNGAERAAALIAELL